MRRQERKVRRKRCSQRQQRFAVISLGLTIPSRKSLRGLLPIRQRKKRNQSCIYTCFLNEGLNEGNILCEETPTFFPDCEQIYASTLGVDHEGH